MLEKYLVTIIICIAAIIIGILLGNGAVYVFNKMPGKWFCDYGKEPDEELLHPTEQRVKSTPWKFCFSGLFVVIAVKMGVEDPAYAIIALATCWLLLLMAIADIKYMIVPDQLIILMMVAGVGFIPHHNDGPLSGIYGAIIGFLIMFVIAIAGRLIYRKSALGGGDIKLFTALGLCLGKEGVLMVFVMSTFMMAIHLVYLLARKKVKRGDKRPFIPYIAVSAAIYMVILREMSYNVWISL